MRVTPYSEAELYRKDFITFLKILRESEAMENEAIKRAEKVGI
jgi:hypothetical protein